MGVDKDDAKETLLPVKTSDINIVKEGTGRRDLLFKAYVIVTMTWLWTGYTITVRYTRTTVPKDELNSVGDTSSDKKGSYSVGITAVLCTCVTAGFAGTQLLSSAIVIGIDGNANMELEEQSDALSEWMLQKKNTPSSNTKRRFALTSTAQDTCIIWYVSPEEESKERAASSA
ncbi:hypothetical protein RB195_010912 [Necator americanus]|uniref:Uncharacterized protein n=1 Tax=Necator americanus TaxID=51031 RepID=A0ABR1D0B8_NECAM